jgi:hypothetical protein
MASHKDNLNKPGQLEKYLNESAAKHNNFNYTNFTAMVESKASIASMARVFNVTRETMYKWIRIYKLQ